MSTVSTTHAVDTIVFRAVQNTVRLNTKTKTLTLLDSNIDIWRRVKVERRAGALEDAKTSFLNLISKRFEISKLEMLSEYALRVKLDSTTYMYLSAYNASRGSTDVICVTCGRDIAHSEQKRGYCPRCDGAVKTEKRAQFSAKERLAQLRKIK